jgi:hypothetical protein
LTLPPLAQEGFFGRDGNQQILALAGTVTNFFLAANPGILSENVLSCYLEQFDQFQMGVSKLSSLDPSRFNRQPDVCFA